MKLAVYARQTIREARGSRRRLLLFMLCLAVGVGAIVTVSTLSSSVQAGIQSEAREIFGADVIISSRRPVPGGIQSYLDEAPLSVEGSIQTTTMREMVTLAAKPQRDGSVDESRLVALKVIGGDYPLYGSLTLDPPRPLNELLSPQDAVVGPDLLAEFNVEVGDVILIRSKPFRIAGTVTGEAGELGITLPIGPRVFLSDEGFGPSSLLDRALGEDHSYLLKLPAEATDVDVEAVEDHLEAVLPTDDRYRVRTYLGSQARMSNSVENISRFLGLVGLLSLLIGSVGVAQTVRAWIAERIDAIAVMRCLGMRPREIMLLYAGQTALLGLVGSLLGAGIGIAMILTVPAIFLRDVLPPDFIRPWQPWPIIQGVAFGVIVSLVFSIPPLLDIRRVPPMRVFQSDCEPLKRSRVLWIITTLVLGASVLAAATWQGGSFRTGAVFTGGLAIVILILVIAAMVLSFLAARVPRDRGRIWLRHGLARLARPGASTVSSIVAVGLGVMIVFAIHLVERHLTGLLEDELPDAPTSILANVQPGQIPDVKAILDEHGARDVEIIPLVRAKLRAIDGVPTTTLLEQRRRRGRDESGERERGPEDWALRRELRLTYYDALPEGNQILEGALWSDPDAFEISIEQGYAESLAVSLGSTMTIDASGTVVDLKVTSIRSVSIKSPTTFFFVSAEPGVLEDVPHVCTITAKLPKGNDELVRNALALKFSNIVALQVGEVANRLLAILSRVTLGVKFLGAFAVMAGVLILAGSISASYIRRGREVALLKTIGMTRREIATIFTVEYALIGCAAALIGGGAGGLLAWAVVTQLMQMEWVHRPWTYAITLAGTLILVVAAGIAASSRSLRVSPIRVLRSQ